MGVIIKIFFLMNTIILQAAVDQSRCICIKRAGYNIYEPICGECRDPCALKFVVDRYSTSPSDYIFEPSLIT